MRNSGTVAASGLLEEKRLMILRVVCSRWGRQEDVEAASVREAKEAVSDLTLQR